MLAVRPFGIFLLKRRNRRHLAVFPLATQPAEKGTLQLLRVKPIGLCTSVLPRDRNASGVNDVGLNSAGAEPPRQPETIPARLEGDSNSDGAADELRTGDQLKNAKVLGITIPQSILLRADRVTE